MLCCTTRARSRGSIPLCLSRCEPCEGWTFRTEPGVPPPRAPGFAGGKLAPTTPSMRAERPESFPRTNQQVLHTRPHSERGAGVVHGESQAIHKIPTRGDGTYLVQPRSLPPFSPFPQPPATTTSLEIKRVEATALRTCAHCAVEKPERAFNHPAASCCAACEFEAAFRARTAAARLG